MTTAERLDEARAAFERRLVAVGPEDWDLPTPCDQWDVRDVVNHVVGQEYRTALLLRGGTVEQYVATREADFLGDDPVAAWDRGCRELNEALTQPGAWDRPVEYRFGPLPGRVLIDIRVFDMTVHTWDLARGLGVDDHLGNDLVSWALDQLTGPLQFVLQAFTDAGPPPENADGQGAPTPVMRAGTRPHLNATNAAMR